MCIIGCIVVPSIAMAKWLASDGRGIHAITETFISMPSGMWKASNICFE